MLFGTGCCRIKVTVKSEHFTDDRNRPRTKRLAHLIQMDIIVLSPQQLSVGHSDVCVCVCGMENDKRFVRSRE